MVDIYHAEKWVGKYPPLSWTLRQIMFINNVYNNNEANFSMSYTEAKKF